MHPVLAKAAYPFAEEVAGVGRAEAQISPAAKLGRWSAQQVVEHLILGMRKSREELERSLRSKSCRLGRSTLLQRMLSYQLFLGGMTRGLPALPSLTPVGSASQDGVTLSGRFLAEAEQLSKVLGECRLAFGTQPCGNHPIYGALRVEEWRNYHAVHIRHHVMQLRECVAFARKQADAPGLDKAAEQKQEALKAGDPGRAGLSGGALRTVGQMPVSVKDRTNGDKRR